MWLVLGSQSSAKRIIEAQRALSARFSSDITAHHFAEAGLWVRVGPLMACVSWLHNSALGLPRGHRVEVIVQLVPVYQAPRAPPQVAVQLLRGTKGSFCRRVLLQAVLVLRMLASSAGLHSSWKLLRDVAPRTCLLHLGVR